MKISDVKDIVTLMSTTIAAIAARGTLWSILLVVYQNPVWIVVVLSLVFAWWQWRTKRLYRDDSYHNYDSAVYWQKRAEKERKIYDQLIADLASDHLHDTLAQVFEYARRTKYRKFR